MSLVRNPFLIALALVLGTGIGPSMADDSFDLYPKGTRRPEIADPAVGEQRSPRPDAQVAAADMDAWRQELGEYVDARLHFPLIGRLQREGGTTGIRLIINRNGHVESATVEESSGNEDIDDVTRRFFEDENLPPLPASFQAERLSMLYVIQYTLVIQ